MGRSRGGEADLKVYVRIRPINSREKAEGATHSAFEGVSETSITLEGKRQPYSFNGIFEAGSTQEEVYKRCGKQAVDNVFDGFNSLRPDWRGEILHHVGPGRQLGPPT
jgi:hypothetical protein